MPIIYPDLRLDYKVATHPSRKPRERKPTGSMPMLGNSLLLDTSVVVKHFRDPTAVVDKLAEYEELYLPQPALGELYYWRWAARPMNCSMWECSQRRRSVSRVPCAM